MNFNFASKLFPFQIETTENGSERERHDNSFEVRMFKSLNSFENSGESEFII